MVNLSGMTTEERNQSSMELDMKSALEIVTLMNNEDSTVAQAVSKVLPKIAQAAECAANAIGVGGRLIYIGAGTSGRLGVLDAAECPPTFGVSPEVVLGIIAGGTTAFLKAVEGAEDSMELCVEDLKHIGLTENDMVIGIAASGRTPYVIGGLKYAESVHCTTAAIACNQNSKIGQHAQIAIDVVVGPEVISGSTRLKAGTAQKMILNMISTTAMVLVGKVYQNLMVDVVMTNEKLHTRAENIVVQATGVEAKAAKAALEQSNGNVKIAVTMLLLGVSALEAIERLEKAQGHVRRALG